MHHKPAALSTQQGFTLIELMIAITLGLLISAAALMIFLSSQRSLAIQGGMGEIQQNAIFGLRNLTYDLRHINLDTSNNGLISRNGEGSGIVFEPAQSATALTADQVTIANKDAGAMDVNSDQLTVQFQTRTQMTQCEGEEVGADILIVQRYYIRPLPSNQQPSGVSAQNRRYALYCDVIGAGSADGVPVILDAESFKVSIGTRKLNNTIGRTDDTIYYQTLAEYITNPLGDTVVSLEIGVVLRSSNSVHQDRNITANQVFNIAGQDVRLTNPPTTSSFLRVPLSQVVAIRNSQGVE